MRLAWKADGREAAGAGGFGRDLQIRFSLRPSDRQSIVFAPFWAVSSCGSFCRVGHNALSVRRQSQEAEFCKSRPRRPLPPLTDLMVAACRNRFYDFYKFSKINPNIIIVYVFIMEENQDIFF